MRLTVLSVAYSLSAVRPETAGGAEQVLAMLDDALTRAGHRSIVVACEGSRVSGILAASVREALKQGPVDMVHMHGQDFAAHLPPPGPPVLVTLHVPRSWYPRDPLETTRPNTWFNCVSATQRETWPDDPRILPYIANGVPVHRLRSRVRKRGFALCLGRICPEKGFHIAIGAAARARVPLLIAGEVYPYEAHQRYFREEFLPRLNGSRSRFLGPAGFERKRRLLTAARCLLAPSQVPETSSLAAMEALACGTPVVAYPAGALREIVEHGKTGFLVSSEEEMAEAILAAGALDPAVCRRAACQRFAASRTIREYFDLYERLAGA
ncbi:MAG TPA: glycosyltransferase [Bryobacteraceae bacterium]|nr:glycosyltransferase [Bryobacteraceae bacterium]HOQ47339.1 glycosyltransferase [Bryobacteraceae bacterium]HPQ14005.1 glycosyltransferase [Bryobacteraceae bacterium]HPU73876.1 glycosyltransferase [Bryobacteraceae bacterium]